MKNAAKKQKARRGSGGCGGERTASASAVIIYGAPLVQPSIEASINAVKHEEVDTSIAELGAVLRLQHLAQRSGEHPRAVEEAHRDMMKTAPASSCV